MNHLSNLKNENSFSLPEFGYYNRMSLNRSAYVQMENFRSVQMSNFFKQRPLTWFECNRIILTLINIASTELGLHLFLLNSIFQLILCPHFPCLQTKLNVSLFSRNIKELLKKYIFRPYFQAKRICFVREIYFMKNKKKL